MSNAAKPQRKKQPPRLEELVASGAKPAEKALRRRKREYVAPTTPEEALAAAWRTWNLRTSPHTKAARSDDLRQFGRWLGLEESPRETLDYRAACELLRGSDPRVTRERAQEWLSDMEEDGLSAPTISRRATTLRSWLRELGDHGLTWQIRLKVPKFDPYDRAEGPPSTSVEDVIGQLEEPAKEDARAARDRALVLLLYDQALRRMSAISLEVNGIDFRRSRVLVQVKNTGDEVWRTISSRTAAALALWLEHRGAQPGPVFCRIWPRTRAGPVAMDRTKPLGGPSVSEITKKLNLGPSHGLRHAAATELKRRGGSPWLIQALLRHRNIQTTQVYLDQTGDEAGRASRILAGEEGIDDEQR